MIGEKIRIVLVKRNMTKSDLAKKLGWSPTNIYNKFKRDNFSEDDMIKIAEVLDCDFEASFVLRDTNERI